MKELRTVGLTMLALLAGCSRSKPAKTEPAVLAVETAAIASRRLNMTDRLPGQLLPYQAVDIYPKVTGFIEELRVDVGSRVRKGDRLLRLSAPELVAQRAQAEAAMQAAEAQVTSAKARLRSEQGTNEHLAAAAKTPGVVAANDLMVGNEGVEAARGGAAAADQNVAAARAALRGVSQLQSYLDIFAPFTGTITARNLHPGALVGPQAGQPGAVPILQLVDTDHLRLIVPVPEAEASAIELGEKVSFSIPAYPGLAFVAPVARISHAINLQTRTMSVELDVKNQDGKLSPGSFAMVTWPVRRDYPTLFVPVSSVTSDQQRSFVIRVANGSAAWVPVQTGASANGEIEVVGGLQPGDEVVRNATDSIRNGQKVSVKAPAPAEAAGGKR